MSLAPFAGRLPPLTSPQTFRVYLKNDRFLERLVLPQLDILLDHTTTFPPHVYATAPIRIHRVDDLAEADVELVWDAETKTLVVSPRESPALSFQSMSNFPPTFDENSLRQQYRGKGSPLPPFAEYIYNAARAFALLKHRNPRDGPRDMRSEVAIWVARLVQGSDALRRLPSCGMEVITDVDLFMQEKGCEVITQEVYSDGGHGIVAHNYNPNALYVALVKIPSITLKPEICYCTQIQGDGGEALLFQRNASGEVLGLLRFEVHAGQSFNVDIVLVVFSSEPIDDIDDMIAEKKVWDAMNVTFVCHSPDDSDTDTIGYGEEEQDITDALVRSARDLKL
ncbi:unnamed protein product [Peniophora sp. CBMAI 1063]|nr:unnamed protein product [Peniophora sp. CBMAI 1063]